MKGAFSLSQSPYSIFKQDLVSIDNRKAKLWTIHVLARKVRKNNTQFSIILEFLGVACKLFNGVLIVDVYIFYKSFKNRAF